MQQYHKTSTIPYESSFQSLDLSYYQRGVTYAENNNQIQQSKDVLNVNVNVQHSLNGPIIKA